MKKKILFYLFVFFVPITLFFIIATITNHVPLGKYLFNVYDGYFMYPSLLVHTIRSIKEGNVFFTFLAGLGVDFYNIKTLYMNSPLNLLFIFFKENMIFEFYTFLIYLRVGLSSLSMAVLLNYLTKENGYGLKQWIFSLIYAFTTYAIACSIHIMWMDSYVLLPIVIMGLEKILNNERCNLYTCILALIIIINFYIGYMVCIFLLLYFIYRSIVLNKFKIKYIKKFILSSLLAALISSFVLIPEVISLLGGRGTEFSMEALKGIDIVSFVSTVYNLFPTSYLISDNMYGSFIVYFSLFAFVLNIYFYFNKNIRKKTKIATFIFTLFFFISSFVNCMDYSWNMFQQPIWWQHRYSFVASFFFLFIAYQSYDDISEVEFSNTTRFLICIIVFVLLLLSFSYKLSYMLSGFTNNFIIYIFIGFIVFFIYIFYLKYKKVKILMVLLIIFELSLNCYQTLNMFSNIEVNDSIEYLKNIEVYEELDELDDSFYRVIDVDDNHDDSLLFGYNSVSLFSSSYNNKILHFLNKVGVLEKNINTYDIEFNNPAILSLLNVKYIVGDSSYYKKISDNLYENEELLSLGFAVSESFKELELTFQYWENIENIYASLVGYNTKLFYDVKLIEDFTYQNASVNKSGTVLLNNKDDDSTIMYSFLVTHDGILVPNSTRLDSYTTIYINDKKCEYDKEFDGIIEVKNGDKVEVNYTFESGVNYEKITISDFSFKIMDYEKFKNIYNDLKSIDSLENIDENNGVFSASINCTKDETIFLSIPYSEGFRIFVDGEEVEYYELLNTFIGFNLDKGEHKIEVKYVSKGFYAGCIFSLIGLFIVIFNNKYKILY